MKLIDQVGAIKCRRTETAIAIAVERFGAVPEVVYTVGHHGNNFDPLEWEVVHVADPPVLGTWFKKQPTRETIAAYETAEPIIFENIFLHVRRSNTSMAFKASDVGSKWTAEREPMEAKAQELREYYTLKPGQFFCAQCGKKTDEANKVRRRIIARQYPGFGKEFDHCSDRCASHNQMAHEG